MDLLRTNIREAASWKSMRSRCNNPNNSDYFNYGGRGITVCKRWDSFKAFFADMGLRPENHSLDRSNSDGNYEPNNCRWATRTEQALNTRIPSNNTSGLKGVTWHRLKSLWLIRFQGTFLGYSSDFFEACCLRKSVEAQHKLSQ